MNINILRYSLFGIAGGQEVDHNFSRKNVKLHVVSERTRCKAYFLKITMYHQQKNKRGKEIKLHEVKKWLMSSVKIYKKFQKGNNTFTRCDW